MADQGLTLNGIFALMRDWFQGSQGTNPRASDFTPGSVLRTLMEAVAVPIEELFYRLYVTLPQRFFVDLAVSDDDVDALAKDRTFDNVRRKQATKASGVARFTAPAGTLIPGGTTIVGQDNGSRYTVDADSVVASGASYVDAAVTATTEGAAGNLSPGRPMSLQGGISGVTKVEAGPTGIGGGSDRESNGALKARIKGYFATTITGTPKAIVQEAMNVAGVKRAFFKGGYPAGGWWTCFVDDGSGGASAAILSAVYDALAKHRDAEILYKVAAGNVIQVAMNVHIISAATDQATQDAMKTAATKAINDVAATLGYEDDWYNHDLNGPIDASHSSIASASVTFTGPSAYQGIGILISLNTATGLQQMKNPVLGTLFRAGAITFTFGTP